MIEIDGVISPPLVLNEPARYWQEQYDDGTIPESLFRLYKMAGYFSYGSTPSHFCDSEGILFPYIESLANGIRISFIEISKLAPEIKKHQENIFTPIKKMKGQSWDPDAGDLQLRAFKYLVLNLSGALDLLSEMIAVFLYPEIPHLRVGRSSVVDLKNFIEEDLIQSSLIISPKRPFVEDIHTLFRKIISCESSEKEWLDLLLMYRNKLTHLGLSTLQNICLHDEAGNFYTFLPKQWPYFHKQHVKPADDLSPPPESMEVFFQFLLKQDICDYVDGLVDRVRALIDAGIGILCNCYTQCKNYEYNNQLYHALMKEKKSFAFEYFESNKEGI